MRSDRYRGAIAFALKVKWVLICAIQAEPSRDITKASALHPAAALAPALSAKGMRCTVPGLTPNLAAALRTDRPPLRPARTKRTGLKHFTAAG